MERENGFQAQDRAKHFFHIPPFLDKRAQDGRAIFGQTSSRWVDNKKVISR